jgi:hypothetical protein
MTRQDVVVSFSIGSSFILLVCTLLVAFAIFSQPILEPSPIIAPPRLGPASTGLKEAIDELKYGPVNRDRQNEVKDGLLSRLRARRAPSCAPQTYANGSVPAYRIGCNPAQEISITCPPRSTGATTESGVEYPAIVPRAPELPPSIDWVLPPPASNPPSCPNCPVTRTELKTGAFFCSHCRSPCVGDEWHTDWLPDGTPLTYLCTRCNSRLSDSQKRSVYQRYIQKQQASPDSLRGALYPEVSP